MNDIEKGLKLKGRAVEIPDCSRNDLPQFCKDMGYKVGAEIGVYKGDFTKKYLEAGLKMYGIDPWMAYDNYNEFKNQGLGRFQARQDFLMDHTKRNLGQYIENGQCELIRKTSMDALKDFEDESLDFIYIDGHHGFRYIAEDLVEWTQKVKKGGVISGHDYALNKKDVRDPHVLQVKYVVDAYTLCFHVDDWYVLGRKNAPGERVVENGIEYFIDGDKKEKRDKWRSWMWIKQ